MCSGCRSVLLYPRGATNVCCALCNAITSPPGMCHSILSYKYASEDITIGFIIKPSQKVDFTILSKFSSDKGGEELIGGALPWTKYNASVVNPN